MADEKALAGMQLLSELEAVQAAFTNVVHSISDARAAIERNESARADALLTDAILTARYAQSGIPEFDKTVKALQREAQEAAQALLRTHGLLSEAVAERDAMREMVQAMVDAGLDEQDDADTSYLCFDGVETARAWQEKARALLSRDKERA